MNEINIAGVEIQWVVCKHDNEKSYYKVSMPYSKKHVGKILYFKNFEGKIEKDKDDKCSAILVKSTTLLPRSIYPLLTKGFIIMMNPKYGLETYQIINEYKEIESEYIE